MTTAEAIWTCAVFDTVFLVLDAAESPFSVPRPVGNTVRMLR